MRKMTSPSQVPYVASPQNTVDRCTACIPHLFSACIPHAKPVAARLSRSVAASGGDDCKLCNALFIPSVMLAPNQVD
jgi:hypothetical protein